MSDRREEIIISYVGDDPYVYRPGVINIMDEYMKESCLALLQYMADNSIRLSLASTSQEPLFMWKGELLTKEQVFENFL